MPGVKTKAMTLRVTPAFKQLLDAAAMHEQRSRTNLIERLVVEHCRALGLTALCAEEVAVPESTGTGEVEEA